MIAHAAGRLGRILSAFALSLFISTTVASADTLQGRVLDPADRPVAAAQVLVLRGQTVIARALTTADGRFGPLAVAAGTYDVAVVAAGLRLPATHVTITRDGTLDLTLKLSLAAIGESVVVSASRVDTPSSRVPDSVTVVDRQALEQQQLGGVADALRLVPGFGVTASGGTGAITSLFPRGGESDYTLVLVDGIEQNAFGGGFDAAHLATADVQRIEVVRGPQSALYGGGAIGGIVHVITAHGGGIRGRAQMEAGAYGTRASSGSIAGTRHAVTFGAGLDWLSTDGDRRTRASLGGPVANNEYSRTSGSGSIGWSDRASRRVRLDVKAGKNERGFPGPFGSDPAGFYGGLDRISKGTNKTAAVGGSAVFGQGGSVFHHVQMNWARATSDFRSPSFFTPGAVDRSSDATRRIIARYQLDVETRRVGLSAGAEWLGEQAENTFVTGLTFQPVPVKRTATGVFVEARPALGDRVFANVGLRLERLDRAALEESPGSRPAFHSQVVWSANPKVAVAWFARRNDAPRAALGWTKLRFGAGTGIKSPTAFEIAFTDNPGLKPERSRSFDAGIEQAFAASRLVADATWFHNRYDDLIVSVGTGLAGASRYRTDNIANARARGVEIGATWRPASSLSIRGGWTRLDTAVLGLDTLPAAAPRPYTVGQRLIRRPRAAGALDVTWAERRGTAFVSLNGRGTMLDLEPNFGSSVFNAPGYVATTIGGSVQLHGAVALYGRIENAFDRSYEETLGFPARGRSASVGIRVTHGH
ncbi:MAG: TonB-dependent receptor [Vicinamibacterales bacterium]